MLTFAVRADVAISNQRQLLCLNAAHGIDGVADHEDVRLAFRKQNPARLNGDRQQGDPFHRDRVGSGHVDRDLILGLELQRLVPSCLALGLRQGKEGGGSAKWLRCTDSPRLDPGACGGGERGTREGGGTDGADSSGHTGFLTRLVGGGSFCKGWMIVCWGNVKILKGVQGCGCEELELASARTTRSTRNWDADTVGRASLLQQT